jgi:hypothetical protein
MVVTDKTVTTDSSYVGMYCSVLSVYLLGILVLVSSAGHLGPCEGNMQSLAVAPHLRSLHLLCHHCRGRFSRCLLYSYFKWLIVLAISISSGTLFYLPTILIEKKFAPRLHCVREACCLPHLPWRPGCHCKPVLAVHIVLPCEYFIHL